MLRRWPNEKLKARGSEGSRYRGTRRPRSLNFFLREKVTKVGKCKGEVHNRQLGKPAVI